MSKIGESNSEIRGEEASPKSRKCSVWRLCKFFLTNSRFEHWYMTHSGPFGTWVLKSWKLVDFPKILSDHKISTPHFFLSLMSIRARARACEDHHLRSQHLQSQPKKDAWCSAVCLLLLLLREGTSRYISRSTLTRGGCMSLLVFRRKKFWFPISERLYGPSDPKIHLRIA